MTEFAGMMSGQSPEPTPPADLGRVRGAVARLMVEDHLDWQQILEGELAQLLGVAPGREPFTWRWHDHVAEGIGIDDECPICLARSDYWSGGKCEVCSNHSDGSTSP